LGRVNPRMAFTSSLLGFLKRLANAGLNRLKRPVSSYYSGITRNTERRRGCTEFHGEKKTKFAHNTMF